MPRRGLEPVLGQSLKSADFRDFRMYPADSCDHFCDQVNATVLTSALRPVFGRSAAALLLPQADVSPAHAVTRILHPVGLKQGSGSRLAVAANDKLIEQRAPIHTSWLMRTATAPIRSKVVSERTNILRSMPNFNQGIIRSQHVTLGQSALEGAWVNPHVFRDVERETPCIARVYQRGTCISPRKDAADATGIEADLQLGLR